MKRYTAYYYELKSQWFVFDNQTNCIVAETGTVYKQHAEEMADSLNEQEDNHPVS